MGNILLVDDDPIVRDTVSDYLRAVGHSIIKVSDGIDALGLADGCDLVTLNLVLPDVDGLEIFRRIRSRGAVAPVIMLTAEGSEADRVLGLELGADDYLAKSPSPRGFVLRVNAVLRRQQPQPERGTITDGNLALDLTTQETTLAGETLTPTLHEFDLLTHLIVHSEEVFPREELVRVVWSWDVGDISAVTVYAQWLRGKAEPDLQHPTRPVTVWGREYRWEAQ